MIVGLIVFVLNCIGIYGFFNGIAVLLYVSCVASIIEEILGVTSGQQKGFMSIPLAIAFAIGAIITGKASFFYAMSIFMTFEGAIIFIVGLIPMMIILFSKKNILEDENNTDVLKEDNNTTEKILCKVCGKEIEYNEYGTCSDCHQIILKRIENKKKIEDTKNEEMPEWEKEYARLLSERSIEVEENTNTEKEDMIQEKRFCTGCGKEIETDWKFCKFCGNKID